MLRAIRIRLTLQYVGAVAVFLAGFVALDYWSLRSNLLDRVDERLAAGAQALSSTLAEFPPGWTATPTQVAGLRRGLEHTLPGERCVAAVAMASADSEHANLLAVGGLAEHAGDLGDLTPPQPGAAPAEPRVIRLADEPVRAVALAVKDAAQQHLVLWVAVSVATVEDTLAEGLLEHIGMSLGLILVISLVGFLVIGRALAPVRRSMAQIRQFSADVSHELNTPLTVMRGEVEVALRQERTPAEYQARLSSLLDEVGRLSRIIDDLLFLASLDSAAAPTAAPVALDRVVREAHEEVYRLADRRQVTLQLGDNPETQVRGDAALLRRLVVNLLTNAIKFTPAGGQVDVALARSDSAITLRVADTGVGIPPTAQGQVFERFFRADPSRTQDGQAGAGLGLAIVKQVADLHGCDVTLESVEGQGTAVTVRWSA